MLKFFWVFIVVSIFLVKISYAQSYEEAIAYLDEGNEIEGLNILKEIINNEPQNYEALYARSYWYMTQEEYENALLDYDQLINFYPDSTELYIYRGQSLQMLEEHAEAEQNFFTALEKDETNVEALTALGNLYFDLALFEDALEFFEKANEFSNDESLTFNKATTLYYLERYEEALAEVETLLQSNPENWDAQRLKALICIDVKNYTKTIEVFELMEKEGVELFVEDFYYWGLTYYEQGDYTKAAYFLELPEAHEDADLYYLLGKAYFKLGDFSTALEKFNIVIDLVDAQDEINAPIFYDRAVTLVKLRKIPLAEKDLEQAVYLSPEILEGKNAEDEAIEVLQDIATLIKLEDRKQSLDSIKAEGWYDRSQALLDEGNPEVAFKNIEKSLEIQADNPKFLLLQGVIQMLNMQYNAALESLDKTLENADFSIEKDYVIYLKAVAYTEKEMFQQAQEEIDKALALNQESADYYAQKATIFFEQGQFEKAIQEINKALEKDPLNSNFYIDRALYAYHLKNYEAALQDVNTVLSTEPEKAMAYYVRGLANMGLQNYEAAAKDFELILDNFPEDEEVKRLYYEVSQKK